MAKPFLFSGPVLMLTSMQVICRHICKQGAHIHKNKLNKSLSNCSFFLDDCNLRLLPCREPLPRLANHSPAVLCLHRLLQGWHCSRRVSTAHWIPTVLHGCLPFLHFLITPLRVICECLRKHKGPSQKAGSLVTRKAQADSGVCSFAACLSWVALGTHPWVSTCHKSPLPLSNSCSEGRVSSGRA